MPNENRKKRNGVIWTSISGKDHYINKRKKSVKFYVLYFWIFSRTFWQKYYVVYNCVVLPCEVSWQMQLWTASASFQHLGYFKTKIIANCLSVQLQIVSIFFSTFLKFVGEHLDYYKIYQSNLLVNFVLCLRYFFLIFEIQIFFKPVALNEKTEIKFLSTFDFLMQVTLSIS